MVDSTSNKIKKKHIKQLFNDVFMLSLKSYVYLWDYIYKPIYNIFLNV